jgi:hypothetical protein
MLVVQAQLLSLNWKKKHYIALYGELALEEAMDLLEDRLWNEWINEWMNERLPVMSHAADICVFENRGNNI